MPTNSPENEERRIVDPLQEAMRQYGQYLELTKLTKILPDESDDENLEYRRTWDHPLGVALSSQG